ncbi:hypothetical protein Hypma_014279 [Hypsizygus marmoreus]|uniref:Uncharacterized protein n=1 Tax=Hypsizygus marmoreus TaxID=39966 RepID=A0A369JCQ9_HYPMA|nr:hypothetical protein Hypma_014279 [Hypsizygus marmoreus]
MSNPARTSKTTALLGDTPTFSINSLAVEALLNILNNRRTAQAADEGNSCQCTTGFADQLLTSLREAGVATPTPMTRFENHTRRHCATCYKNYIEKNNHLNACQIYYQQAEVRDLLVSKWSSGYETQSVVTNQTGAPSIMTVNSVEGPDWSTTSTPPGKVLVMEMRYRCYKDFSWPGPHAPIPDIWCEGRHTTVSEIVDYVRFLGRCAERKCLRRIDVAPPRTGADAPAGTDVTQAGS